MGFAKWVPWLWHGSQYCMRRDFPHNIALLCTKKSQLGLGSFFVVFVICNYNPPPPVRVTGIAGTCRNVLPERCDSVRLNVFQ